MSHKKLPHVFLSKDFLAQYEQRPVKWGFPSGPNSLGELTYRRTYSRDGERFFETIARNVEGLFEKIEEHCARYHVKFTKDWAETTARTMYEKIFTFKFTPPGRGFWMMGTDFVRERTGAGLFNCLRGDTKVLTRDGYRPIKELAGTSPYLMMKTGSWKKAPVSSFGKQRIYEIKLSHSSGYSKSLFATKEHGWFVRSKYDASLERITTGDLVKGMSLQQVFGQGCKTTIPSPQGIQAGLVYGDGTKINGGSRIVLCGNKNKELVKFFPNNTQHNYDYICKEGAILIDGLPSFFKDIPPVTEGRPYLLGWLMGYFAADGTVDVNGLPSISSASLESLQTFKDVAAIIGVGTLPLKQGTRISNLTGKESVLYSVTIIPETLFPDFFLIEAHRKRFSLRKPSKRSTAWRVSEVVDTGITEEVYCATVEDYHSFVIEDHILTSNCAFVSTKNLATEGSKPFRFLMDVSMLGVGCGFDTEGAGRVYWKPCSPEQSYDFVVEDSREGWVDSTGALIDWGLGLKPFPKIRYHKIRGPGELIRGFGGVSSGPEPLVLLHKRLVQLILSRGDRPVSSRDIVDVMNMEGACVVAGNVRRTAEIALGRSDDEEYLDLKNYTRFPERAEYGWTSNNSVRCQVGQRYGPQAERTRINGEPGYWWPENCRAHGRMIDPPDWKDEKADGTNPCVTKDTWVMTSHGPRQVWELLGKQFRAVVDGKEYRSTKNGFFFTGLKRVYNLTTVEGHGIRLTGDHKIKKVSLTRKARETAWVKVKDLKPGDLVSLNDHRLYTSWHGDGTFSEGWLLGNLLGDGHVLEDKARLEYWGEEKAELFAYAKKCLTSSVKCRSDIGSCDGSGVTTAKRDVIGMGSVGLRDLAEDYGIRGDKEIGGKIERTGSKFHAGFLRGWFDADGSVQGNTSKGVSVRLSSVNLNNLHVAQRMLGRLGIISTIYDERRSDGMRSLPDGEGGEKKYFCQAVHELVISGANLTVFSDRVGFTSVDKSKKLTSLLSGYRRSLNRERFVGTVSSVVPQVAEEVFDCTIEGVHEFDGNGLSLHNCGEQTLESYELCNLVETYPEHHATLAEYKETLFYAWLWGKGVSLFKTHWSETNAIMARNLRVGCSQSGIAQFLSSRGVSELVRWSDEGYRELCGIDEWVSRKWGIPESIKKTSIKPSGTVSLPAGATPGAHYPTYSVYIRRVRYAKNHPDLNAIVAAGYHVEPAKFDSNTVVVSFPIKGPPVKTEKEVSLREKVELAVLLQKYWADNQVSYTATFDPVKEGHLVEPLLEEFDRVLKAISFLPLTEEGAYEQMPYEAIQDDEYYRLSEPLKLIQWPEETSHDMEDRFCDGGACLVSTPSP